MVLQRCIHGAEGPPVTVTSGGNSRRPRPHDVFAKIGFTGRRPEVFGRLVTLTGARPGDRVLDIACGTGYLAGLFADAVGPTGLVVGVDTSSPRISHARRTGLANSRFVAAAGDALALADGTFDVVVSSLAVHHMPREQGTGAIAEMFRVLRPAGRLVAVDFRPRRIRLATRMINTLTGPTMAPNPIGDLDVLIRRAGFDPTGAAYLHPLLRYVSAIRPASLA